MATRQGYTDIVEQLLAANANVNKPQQNGFTPLIIASFNGNLDIVNQLLEAKADVNLKGNFKNLTLSALDAAKRRGHNHIVELLKKHGATK
jgi:ankyrin repeat protein